MDVANVDDRNRRFNTDRSIEKRISEFMARYVAADRFPSRILADVVVKANRG